MTIQDELVELDRRWTKAETEADVSTLDTLASDDFMLVGPVGFVLNKQQWLDRYRDRELVTRALAFEDTVTRVYDNVALTIGRYVQEAEHKGTPANGEFRATRIAIRGGSQWRLAGVHLSVIGGSPPFANESENPQ
jgi:hypothetical protein